MSCRFARACSVSPARYSCETCCLNSTLWVRCFAMGLHPLKARLPGQLLKAIPSAPRGPLHQGVNIAGRMTSQSVMKRGTEACPVRQVPAAEIERIVIEQIRSLLLSPEVVVQTWRAAQRTDKGISENHVRSALVEFEPLWAELFPAVQARIIDLMVERID